MRFHVPDTPLALTILWIWIGIVVVSIACYWAVRLWKRRHPPAKPEPVLPYAQRLQQRFAKQRSRRRAGSTGDVRSPPTRKQ